MKNIVILVVCILVVVGIIAYQNRATSQLGLSQGAGQDIKQDSIQNTNQIATSTQLNQDPATITQHTIQTTMDTSKITTATLHTNMGDITIQFFAQKSPNTVANFIKLASSGFYDGVKFHRVIKDFMIQGGDPLTKNDSIVDQWGTGGPGYTFADEFGTDNHNDVGTIAMANAGPNTNGSQFFINVNANNFLDGKHTVFGKVIAGMDVVTAIDHVQTGQNDRPINPIIIQSVSLK